MTDNQWPSFYLHPHTYNAALPETTNVEVTRQIESFFSERFGCDAILTPSGRAAIGLIMRFHVINRGHRVFVTKWSSHCMFYTVGAFSNVTVDFVGTPDMIIINHKWGVPVHLQQQYPNALLLEDSVDSIFLSPRAMFPNGADYELISLSKLLGCYAGGVLFSRCPALTAYARSQQQENLALGRHQSRVKSIPLEQRHDFETCHYYEPWNTAVDANSLQIIATSLPAYDQNREVILTRRAEVQRRLGVGAVDCERVGPVVPLPVSQFRVLANANILTRQFSFAPYLETPSYETVYVLPVHFGIPDETFYTLLAAVSRR